MQLLEAVLVVVMALGIAVVLALSFFYLFVWSMV